MLTPSASSHRLPNILQLTFAATSLSLGISLGLPLKATAQLRPAATQPVSYAASRPMGEVRAANYGALPLAFEANRGQTDANVRFVAHGDGYSVFLTGSAAVLALHKGSDCMPTNAHSDQSPKVCSAESDIMRMDLAGVATGSHAKGPRIDGEDELLGKVNYFIGNDHAKWRTGLPTYAKVRYTGVYPGIDLVYYGSQRQLEYDFVVAPGASPASIRLLFSGAMQPRIEAAGDLSLKGAYGEIVFHRPLVYQQDKDGDRRPVAGQFKLMAKNAVGFSLGRYDRTRPLVIDPVLIYSTYLGGSGGDQGNGIKVDDGGCAYVVGTTNSTNFPVTRRAFQSELSSGGSSVFISKLDATGRKPVYSTYLGGSEAGSSGNAIALDEEGNAYVTGATYAKDFPVTPGAFQETNPSTTPGAPTVFVTKLDRWGSSLGYSTYLGGSGLVNYGQGEGDVGQGIAVDRRRNAYVVGNTASSNFPVTEGAFQTDFTGTDGYFKETFVTKLNPSGSAPVYSTFVGGSDFNFQNAIAIDDWEHAFVAGSGAVAKLNREGSDELYSASLDGLSAFAIAVDREGSAYVAGNSIPPGPPATPGALEGTDAELSVFNAGGPIGFVSKLNRDGSEFEFLTYLEGLNTVPAGVAPDERGAVYVTGSAPAASLGGLDGFQATPDALPAPTPASTGSAAFLVKLDRNATVLNYATMLGGSTNEGANALALDKEGNVYLTGATSSANFPVTEDAFQKVNNDTTAGGSNAFISKFTLQRKDDQTGYSLVQNGLVPTTITVTGTSITCNPYYFSFTINFNVTANVNAPPPYGAVVTLTSSDFIYYPTSITQIASGGWGSSLPQTMSYFVEDPISGTSFPWTLSFSGDNFRLASTLSGSTPCPSP
jgi:hypothetical protein